MNLQFESIPLFTESFKYYNQGVKCNQESVNEIGEHDSRNPGEYHRPQESISSSNPVSSTGIVGMAPNYKQDDRCM